MDLCTYDINFPKVSRSCDDAMAMLTAELSKMENDPDTEDLKEPIRNLKERIVRIEYAQRCHIPLGEVSSNVKEQSFGHAADIVRKNTPATGDSGMEDDHAVVHVPTVDIHRISTGTPLVYSWGRSDLG